MKCQKCRAEIISNTVKNCPYCGSPLAVSPEKNNKTEHATNNENREIAKKIKEAIEAQKAFYKPEITKAAKKLEKAEKLEKVEKVERKKYSTSDIIIFFVSLAITFIVLALILSLLLRR
jgi:hypothetical protein